MFRSETHLNSTAQALLRLHLRESLLCIIEERVTIRRIAGAVLFALTLSAFASVGASSITAVSCNASDVQAALNLARAGDTIYIGGGTCHWTTSVSWTAPANVTLQGAGDVSILGGGDRTVIVDDFAANQALFNITLNATGTLRLTGLTFQGGTGVLKYAGMISTHGPGTMRIDHVHLNTQTYTTDSARTRQPLSVGDRIYGVMDHSMLDFYGVSAIFLYNGGGADGAGNGSWASATNFGASTFFFFEDNEIHGDTRTGPSRVSDCFSGSRAVFRFNTFKYSAGAEAHATGHSGDDRGCRAQETYRNYWSMLSGQTTPVFDIADASSGTALIWGNTVDPDVANNLISFNVTRKNADTYAEVATPNGWGYCGTAFNGTGSKWDGNTNASTGYPCLDQPGRGQGDLLTGFFASKINSTTGTIAWPHQALEPIYVWDNNGAPAAGWGGQFYRNISAGRVTANVEYYPQASGIQTSTSSPFDGTSGTGWGTRANRPATCTTGVAYWSTDQGANWNTTNGSANDGTLDKCTATNTWTNAVYTPYTYPHPLTQMSAPAPPTNVHIAQ
jgi:hypothetical protein